MLPSPTRSPPCVTLPKARAITVSTRPRLNLGQLAGGAGLTHAVVSGPLIDAGLEAGMDLSEVWNTVASGVEAGMANPRSIPKRPMPTRPAAVEDAAHAPPSFEAPLFADVGQWAICEPPPTSWVFVGVLALCIVAGLAARGGSGSLGSSSNLP